MSSLIIRKAIPNDIEKYFEWVNDSSVRQYSYESKIITWEQHVKWFNEKLNDPNCTLYIFQNNCNNFVGQVRLQAIDKNNYIIGLSIAVEFRGKGYGSQLLKLACDVFLLNNLNVLIHAYIKEENLSSKFIFEKAGFLLKDRILYNNVKSFHYILYANK